MNINGAECHERLVKLITQKLAFSEKADYAAWRKEIREKFIELLGIDKCEANACPLNVDVESTEQMDGYRRIRFTYESEKGAVVPCYLLVPDTGKEKYPVVITLQGHSSGFHNSIGVPKYEGDENYSGAGGNGRGAFAVQAVKEGYIALAIEQRGMGERRPVEFNRRWAHMCGYEGDNSFMFGRTLVGERAWDVSKAIDALASFSECDLDKIAITGNSGGGTMSFYAACYDERIKISVPSCAFCDYKSSIMAMHHCTCNYIPNAYQWFEMQDLSALIAPREFVAVAGKEDPIFPIEGVRTAFETVKKIYEKAGAKDNCKLIETPKGHWWCVDIIWPTVKEKMQKLGWIK